MVLKDHVDWNAMTGRNPLMGQNDERFGPRFVAMHDAYDRDLRNIGLEGMFWVYFNLVKNGLMVSNAMHFSWSYREPVQLAENIRIFFCVGLVFS